MKRELIKTENYLLVVDNSEIKQGDWFLEKAGRLGPIYFNEGKVNFHMKKIIAHLPLNNSPILEGVPLLPPLNPTHFEFEMERGDAPYYYVIKTTTNSQGQEVACGKYVYAS